MNEHIVIITGAAPISPEVVARIPTDALLIAVDGGLDHALAVGLEPTRRGRRPRFGDRRRPGLGCSPRVDRTTPDRQGPHRHRTRARGRGGSRPGSDHADRWREPARSHDRRHRRTRRADRHECATARCVVGRSTRHRRPGPRLGHAAPRARVDPVAARSPRPVHPSDVAQHPMGTDRGRHRSGRRSRSEQRGPRGRRGRSTSRCRCRVAPSRSSTSPPRRRDERTHRQVGVSLIARPWCRGTRRCGGTARHRERMWRQRRRRRREQRFGRRGRAPDRPPRDEPGRRDDHPGHLRLVPRSRHLAQRRPLLVHRADRDRRRDPRRRRRRHHAVEGVTHRR